MQYLLSGADSGFEKGGVWGYRGSPQDCLWNIKANLRDCLKNLAQKAHCNRLRIGAWFTCNVSRYAKRYGSICLCCFDAGPPSATIHSSNGAF